VSCRPTAQSNKELNGIFVVLRDLGRAQRWIATLPLIALREVVTIRGMKLRQAEVRVASLLLGPGERALQGRRAMANPPADHRSVVAGSW
jgi:hypothetical protein